ncbi:hypothetical protein MWU49_17280 [Alcanivorax sp. S6407]|uniref:hypothetical protein n=1 Tax=Alcanivorax sp. S6407 TaxID=2926424 RepID=UPI001FF27C36|nr:hypothetical protein [Alcanivorax sp. S6407]MCK0155472.1 hypothetical protein [Alcanivorax sp. S6407]
MAIVKTLLLPLVLLSVTSIAQAVAAEPIRQITWEDLVPRVEIYNDPFLELTPEQKFDLIVVSRTRGPGDFPS